MKLKCKKFLIDMITDKYCERCHHYNEHSMEKQYVTGCHQCWMIVGYTVVIRRYIRYCFKYRIQRKIL